MDHKWALAKARELVGQGADIVDVGAESARTNRAAIATKEELKRLLPFLEQFPAAWEGVKPRPRAGLSAPPSRSTRGGRRVAAASLKSGGHLLNDLSTLQDDRNARICAQAGAALLILHSVGSPKIPHTHVFYQNAIDEMVHFFRDRISLAERSGVPRDAIILDPGIDFAKQVADNLRNSSRELERFHRFGRPVLLPVSRKASWTCPRHSGSLRNGTRRPACIVAGMLRGASIFRVHNVEMAWRVVLSVHHLRGT